MNQQIIRTTEEIDKVLDKAIEAEEENHSEYPGMTYEQGLKAMYDWLVGNTEENPVE